MAQRTQTMAERDMAGLGTVNLCNVNVSMRARAGRHNVNKQITELVPGTTRYHRARIHRYNSADTFTAYVRPLHPKIQP